MSESDIKDQTRNSWRAWLRWAVASVVGGVVSGALVWPVPLFFANTIRPPTHPFDFGAIFLALCFMFIGAVVCGPVGGWVHWLVVGRPAISVGRWIGKWSAGCWGVVVSVLVKVFFATNVNVEPIEHFVDIIGVWTAYTLASAVFGLILSAILVDTRAGRGEGAPGP